MSNSRVRGKIDLVIAFSLIVGFDRGAGVASASYPDFNV